MSLARHLNGFGEIRITRLEPENTVAWEGESASGTVTLEASGWGTRVRLTAAAPEPSAKPAALPEPLSIVSEVLLPPRGLLTLISHLRRPRRQGSAPGCPTLATAPQRAPRTPSPDSGDPGDLLADLETALDSLGSAHHRPYSRA